MAIVDRVRDLVTPLVEAEAVELYDVEHAGGVLRIYVDAPDRVLGDTTTGIDIAVIQRLSRRISQVLDEADPVPGRYTLEVSSPGLERPLRTPEHFRRAVGSEVKVKTHPEVEGARRVRGVLAAADTDGFEIETDAGSRRLAYGDVSTARTVFEWGPTPKPGGRRPTPDLPEKEAPTS